MIFFPRPREKSAKRNEINQRLEKFLKFNRWKNCSVSYKKVSHENKNHEKIKKINRFSYLQENHSNIYIYPSSKREKHTILFYVKIFTLPVRNKSIMNIMISKYTWWLIIILYPIIWDYLWELCPKLLPYPRLGTWTHIIQNPV